MKIIYAEDYADLSRKAANQIAAQVILKPESVLGLATGSSPLGTYRRLIELYDAGDVDFAACRAVNLDEYCGLSEQNDQSYAYFMRENLFRHINIRPENTHIPDGMNRDMEAECRRYEEIISSLGGIDLQLLGIGHNGHIGFNEPDSSFSRYTHCVELAKQTVDANSRFFAKREDVPTHAYTMGIGTIMAANKILLIASGEGKAHILLEMATGPICPQVPASILQLHSDVTVIADKDALGLLMEKAPHLVTGAPVV